MNRELLTETIPPPDDETKPFQRKDEKDTETGPEFDMSTIRVEGREMHIERKLEKGGMGVVYLTKELRREDKETGEKYFDEVVLKLLKPSLLKKERSIARFKRELETQVAAGNDEPQIVKVLAVVDASVEGDETVGLVLEYMEDGDLSNLMKDIRKENPEMSTKEMEQMVSAVGVQLCQAVDGLHRNGLIHRDIKPKNIFVDKAGHYVKLGDFGLARALEGTEVEVPLTKEESDELEKIPSKERKHINKIITKLGSTPGTVSYMPPEAFVGAAPNKGFDLYAIGGVLYTLRTGKIPIRSSGEVTNRVNMVMDRVFSDVPPIHKQLGGAYEPSFLDDIIMTLLERKPEDRKHVTIDGKDYSLESAKDISNTIQELAGKHGVSTESFWSEIE